MAELFRIDAHEAAAQLEVDPAVGLSQAEASARQARHGKNALPSDEGVNWAQLILAQFTLMSWSSF